MQFFNVKNWDDLQHYKDRAPPWIKLYNHLLDDYEFACLQDASKLHLMLIWLLASRNSNRLPFNGKWIGQRIGVSGDVDLNELLESGFLKLEASKDGALHSVAHDASKTLADCKQVATTEERERRAEESREEDKNTLVETKVSTCPHKEIIAKYHEVLPMLSTIVESRWAGSSRAKQLQARWKEDERHQDINFWETYFESVKHSPFYLGQNDRQWKADLGWLTKRDNFDKMIDKMVNL